MGPRLYVFDDASARQWKPFPLTRPVGELLFGSLLLRERLERCFALPCTGHISKPALAGFEEPGAPPVIDLDAVGTETPRIIVSSRAVPDELSPLSWNEPATLELDGETVGWTLDAGSPNPTAEQILDPGKPGKQKRVIELTGSMLGWPWDLVELNAARINADLEPQHRRSSLFGLTDVHVFGGRPVTFGEGVEVEPGVSLDARNGPIHLAEEVRVLGPARLQGPLYVGAHSVLLGGTIAASSVGPGCKIRGEVEACVITGHCNKAHDGFLGHALLGRWVNLGALTTNSDLKNNYSSVRVSQGDREIETGLLKVGCFIGDHVKTGIGTLLTTGSMIGAGSNVFGGGITPKYVPPFSWGGGGGLGTHELDAFLRTAATAMARRGNELGEGMQDLLSRAWEDTRSERE